jgi:hypothetical protein
LKAEFAPIRRRRASSRRSRAAPERGTDPARAGDRQGGSSTGRAGQRPSRAFVHNHETGIRPIHPATGHRHEAVRVPALRSAALFREHPVRALQTCSGLSARAGGAERACPARRTALAAADGARAAAALLRQRRPRGLQLAGAGARPEHLLPGLPAQPHDPGPSTRPRTICCAGSAWRPPSTGWSMVCSGSACPWSAGSRTRTPGLPSISSLIRPRRARKPRRSSPVTPGA